jgi:proline iminopeptidase
MKRIAAVVVSLFVLVLGGCAPQEQQEAGSGSENEGRAGVVAVEGARLHYKIEGAGIPLVLIGSPQFYPAVFSQELREHFQMIFVHARLSVPTEDGFDVGTIALATFADDVEALRQELALEKFAVLGHSVHGLMALEYGRKYPQHTTHVIMLATPARSLLTFSGGGSDFIPEVKEYFDRDTSEERKAIFKRNLEELPEKLSQAPPEKQFGVWYAAHAPYFFFDPNYDPAWLFEDYESNPDVFRQVFEPALEGYDVGQVLDETQPPVFLAVGRRDYGAPPYMWEEYKDKPNFSFNLFEKSGHYPMMEEQELFDQKLIEWAKAQSE